MAARRPQGRRLSSREKGSAVLLNSGVLEMGQLMLESRLFGAVDPGIFGAFEK